MILVENENGLTYSRWYAAATMGLPDGRKPSKTSSELREAWKNGEDPTDWRASFDR